ncbi:MAG: mechanosensitive ion channel domain-containing protein [Methanomethylovorans sp.]|uniref:mechanosensitive ion channel domain-containing protein n=1 Tax=Methanomethylovorans sp. TaxID=2758717 RepID=UPI000ACAF0DE|nr:mechanosensitive ion channel domain-containing protein [Methanomethylovorans sp.]
MVKDSIIKSVKEKFKKIKMKFDLEQLNKAVVFFLIVMLPIIAIHLAGRQEIIPVPETLMKILEGITVVLVSFGGATLFIRLTINFTIGAFGDIGQPEERILLSKLYTFLIYLLATVVVFLYMGIGIQNVALFLGLTATGFAFAIRDVVLSYIIWFMLLTKKPFKIGDYIKVGNEEGQVKHIGMFYVVVDASLNTYTDYTKMLNKVFIERPIRNHSNGKFFSRYADYTRIPNKVFLEKPIRNYGTGKFFSSFDLYLKSVPMDIIDRLEKVREKGDELKDAYATFYLNSDSDGVKISVEFKTVYAERDIIRDRLMSILLQELGQNT